LISPINTLYINEHPNEIVLYHEVFEAELDEMWSFVFSKDNQRWLWLAVDHDTRVIIAFAFGRRKDEVFITFQDLLTPFSISIFYTDDWGSYKLNITQVQHIIGKRNTQIIERKNLTLRTRIKRLCRKTICFSKSVFMHDTVIGLAINLLDFGLIYYPNNSCRA